MLPILMFNEDVNMKKTLVIKFSFMIKIKKIVYTIISGLKKNGK